jgi:hypothetical protein
MIVGGLNLNVKGSRVIAQIGNEAVALSPDQFDEIIRFFKQATPVIKGIEREQRLKAIETLKAQIANLEKQIEDEEAQVAVEGKGIPDIAGTSNTIENAGVAQRQQRNVANV